LNPATTGADVAIGYTFDVLSGFGAMSAPRLKRPSNGYSGYFAFVPLATSGWHINHVVSTAKSVAAR